ncbi:MAG: hypothetical protein K0R57_1493 [Paenibacillaceae bacterium]|nr:hypothetical protein [Paenibacillaceae bacterium]
MDMEKPKQSMRLKRAVNAAVIMLLLLAMLPFGYAVPAHAAAGDTLEPGQVGVIMDDQDQGVQKSGEFTLVTANVGDAYNGAFSFFHYNAAAPQSMIFTPAIPEDGVYDFYVRKPSANKWYNGNVPYTIRSESGTSVVNNPLSANSTTNWVKLGSGYSFRSGGSYSITAGGAGYTEYPSAAADSAIDAIKLIKAGELPPATDQDIVNAELAKYETSALIGPEAAVGQSVYSAIVRLKPGQTASSSVQVAVYAPVDGQYLSIVENDFILKAENTTGMPVLETAAISLTKGTASAKLNIEVVISPENQPGNSSLIDQLLKEDESIFREFVPGIINASEGTLEMTVRIDKPYSEFGNFWDFLFSLIPAQGSLGIPGNSLMAAHIPPMARETYTVGSEVPYEQPLTLLIRNGNNQSVSAKADYTNVSYTVGQPFNLAFAWRLGSGGYTAIYMNGTEIARTSTNMGAILEKFMPFEFMVNRGSPYNVSNLKISTKALPVAQLETSTTTFTQGTDTALLSNITYGEEIESQKFVTPWHESSGYSVVKPVFRSEYGVYYIDESAVYPVLTVNYGDAPKTYTVSIKATNQDNQVIQVPDQTVIVPAGADYRIETLPVPQLDNKSGFWKLETSIRSGAEEAIVYTSAISKVPLDDEAVPDGKYADYYGQHISPKISFAPWKKINTSIARGWEEATVFKWYEVEPVKGHFTWEKPDAYVKKAQAADTDVLAVLGYPSRWASSIPANVADIPASYLSVASNSYPLYPERWVPKDIKFTNGVPGTGGDWSNYVYQSMKRYAGKVKYWEVVNEVNFHPPGLLGAFSGTADEYLLMQKLAYEQAQRVKAEYKQETGLDLELYVTSSGFSATLGPAIAQTEIIYETLKPENVPYYDIFTIHGYEGTGGLTEILSRYGTAKGIKPELELWQGEVFSIHKNTVEARIYDTVEKYMEFLSVGASKFINMGVPADDTFLSRYTQSPTEVFQTTATLQHHIRKVEEYIGKYPAFEGSGRLTVNYYMKRTDNKYVSVLSANELPLSLKVSNPASIVSVQDSYGSTVPVTVDNGVGTILKSNTLFVVSNEPLSFVSALTLTEVPNIANGGFEATLGDPAGGPAAVLLQNWTMGWGRGSYGTNAYVNTVSPYAGANTLVLDSNGAPDNRTFVAQAIRVAEPGTYVLSAWIKKLEGGTDIQPELNIWDGQNDHQLPPVTLTDQYALYSQRYQVTEDVPNLVINVGILSGIGKISVDNVALTLIPDNVSVTMDDSDAVGVVKTGTWTTVSDRPLANASNFSLNNQTAHDGKSSVTYTPDIPLDGMYDVFVFFHQTNGTDDAPYRIVHATGASTKIQSQNLTGGSWIKLGSYPFVTGQTGSVTVTNSHATGHFVLADGVRFTRTGPLDDQALVQLEAGKYEAAVTLDAALSPGSNVDTQVLKLKAGQSASAPITVQRAVYEGSYLQVAEGQYVIHAAANDGASEQVWVEFSLNGATAGREITITYQQPQTEPSPFAVSATFQVGAVRDATALAAGELLHARVSVENLQADAEQAVVMVALFDAGGAMTRLAYASKELGAGTAEELGAGFLLPASVEGCTVKVFVWQGSDPVSSDMQPLAPVITLP